MKRVIVIGGGAAGMMAAVSAAESGARVLLLEKNEKLGKKLFITGKGRCNVTNAAGPETFFANVCTNGKFLYSAYHSFDNQAVMEWLVRAGCPLKTERGDRVFPVSDHSSDVIAAFGRELKKRGVEILLGTEAKELVTEALVTEALETETLETEVLETEAPKTQDRPSKVRERGGKKEKQKAAARIRGVKLSDGRELSADRVIVCTGGLSYPSTGSTGDGYRFARGCGHLVTECTPALVPFRIREAWCGRLAGLSLKNVSLELNCGGKRVYEGFGEMLFTHTGVSGPLILSASSFYKPAKEKNALLRLDLKPALDRETLDRRLLRDFEENQNKQFKNALSGLFPAKLIPVMVELSGILPEKKVNEITREERRSFVELIKGLSLTVEGPGGFEEAVITKGGVSVKEVDPSTMESKKVRGLYFAGEVLDLDALTGGFNLQIAWSTGHLAGTFDERIGI